MLSNGGDWVPDSREVEPRIPPEEQAPMFLEKGDFVITKRNKGLTFGPKPCAEIRPHEMLPADELFVERRK